MKNLIIICALSILVTMGVYAEEAKIDNKLKQQYTKEEIAKYRKAKEAEFEKKLGLTEDQKIKAYELRIQAHKEMRPIINELMSKKQEAKMVKMSRIAIQEQEVRLIVLDKEMQALEKKANALRKKNMKDFEAILTKDQRKILKNMKKEGRKNFELKNRKK